MIKYALTAAAVLLLSNPAFARTETCEASQYGVGDGYHGLKTSSGERFNTYAYTAAHRTRSFKSFVTVTNLRNNRSIEVRINDRGPFVRRRCIDLSHAAASDIGMGGTARVSVVPSDGSSWKPPKEAPVKVKKTRTAKSKKAVVKKARR
jgi:rare lipoprotein A